jgi:DNA-binding NtrC family response regulator
LIVDDEPLVLDSLRRMLVTDGYQVRTSASAEEALGLLERESFDLVITDYAMPGRRGDQLAASIKDKDPHKPVALITAYAEAIHYAGVSLDSVDLVLEKPVGLQAFRRAVANLLACQGSASAATATSAARSLSPLPFDSDKLSEMGRVLVIDDDIEASVMIYGILHAAGYIVDVASAGAEALQMAHSRTPDLIIADLSMPELVSADLLLELRSLSPQVKVVGTSNHNRAAETVPRKELNFSTLLRKPFTHEELLGTVRTALAL